MIFEPIAVLEAVPARLDASNQQILNAPFIVRNHMQDMPALTKWDCLFFSERYGDLVLPVVDRRGEKFPMAVRDYMSYMSVGPDDEQRYYLKDWKFEQALPELRADYTVPALFRTWLDYLPAEVRPSLRWLYIGVKGSGSPLHVDFMHTSAWNMVVSGEKHWLFYPPEQKEYLYDLKVDVFAADLDQFPLLQRTRPVHCIQRPGDIVYTPGGWPHQVVNKESGFSITENFVNTVNYTEVRNHLIAQDNREFVAALDQLGKLGLSY